MNMSGWMRGYPPVLSPTALAKKLGVSRQRAHQLMYPERYAARRAVKERRDQILKEWHLDIRPAYCSRCWKKTSTQAHHNDYSKPLEVVWLCSTCHAIVHPHGYGSISKQKNIF